MGYFGIGIYHPKHEVNIGTLFRSAYSFGASFVFTVGRRYKKQSSDVCNVRNIIPFFEYTTTNDLIVNLPHACKLVGVELSDDAQCLSTYEHPYNCCYLLGAEDHGIPSKVLNKCHEIIRVPNAIKCLNVSVAGSIVMYDRSIKTPQ